MWKEICQVCMKYVKGEIECIKSVHCMKCICHKTMYICNSDMCSPAVSDWMIKGNLGWGLKGWMRGEWDTVSVSECLYWVGQWEGEWEIEY